MMPGMGGIGALQRIKSLYPSLCVVMVTATSDLAVARKALGIGAADYVTKPFTLDYLDCVLNIHLPKGDAHPGVVPAVLAEGGPGAAADTVTPLPPRSPFSRPGSPSCSTPSTSGARVS
jgi:DNA-binding response OmpR family regulator